MTTTTTMMDDDDGDHCNGKMATGIVVDRAVIATAAVVNDGDFSRPCRGSPPPPHRPVVAEFLGHARYTANTIKRKTRTVFSFSTYLRSFLLVTVLGRTCYVHSSSPGSFHIRSIARRRFAHSRIAK